MTDTLECILILVVPITLAVLVGISISRWFIKKHHSAIGILSGALISPVLVLLPLVPIYIYVVDKTQALYASHAPHAGIDGEGLSMLFLVSVMVASVEAVIAFILGLTISMFMASRNLL